MSPVRIHMEDRFRHCCIVAAVSFIAAVGLAVVVGMSGGWPPPLVAMAVVALVIATTMTINFVALAKLSYDAITGYIRRNGNG